MKQGKQNAIWLLGTALTGFLALLSGILLSPVNHYLLAALLVLSAVFLYFLQVFFVGNRNWLDFRAVFTGIWLGTIGLAALRLAEYQKVWLNKTWFLLAIAYLIMQLGVTLGLRLAPTIADKVVSCAKKLKVGRFHLKLNPNRLFGICVVTTLIGLSCFCINVAIKGFIPAFSNIFNAYMVFYTKFHVFAVAAVAVAPLCYYCIATQPLGLVKKIILGLCIFYLVFAFPILVVSRGVFVVAALGLAVCVYYIHGKRLWVLVLCVILIGAGYLFSSQLRNYTEAQMNIFFQPAQIQLPGATESTEPSETTGVTDPTDESTVPGGDTSKPQKDPVRTFVLPPKAAFIYSYVTVSHDNFNEAVMHAKEKTWGLRQLVPFNVILRSQWIEEKLANAEFHQVNPFLNTVNLIGNAYYDLRSVGVAIFMALWSVIFGILQGVYDRTKNVFALLVLGNTMAPVALSFFADWVTGFTHWMIWGVALLAAIAAYVTLAPKNKKA